MERTDEEITEQIARAAKVCDQIGTKFRGLSYEKGVADALGWAKGDIDDAPLSDDDYAEFAS